MVTIGTKCIELSDFKRIVINNESIKISQEAIDKVKKSHDFLKTFAKDKVIYGINTGLGPMAQYKIKNKEQIQLQYNLIRSHACGMGKDITLNDAKAAVLARLNTLLLGYSGVHESVIFLLRDFINHNIIPSIPEHGGVGASGDLVQLSHLALNLIGEGEVYYQNKKRETVEVMKELSLSPIEIHMREGLSLINGTSVMSGIGIMNIIKSEQLLDWSLFTSTLINEIVEAYDDHLSDELNTVKLHKGQNKIAQRMRSILADSKLTRNRQAHLYKPNNEVDIFTDKVQEYYSIRCVPQIAGPILDTIEYSKNIILNEVQSANDNPIIKTESQNVFHGGNFHGDYISLEMDKLRIAITKLCMLIERQVNFLMNHKINDILPPFVNLGTLGLNLGMQGTQFTAVSTTAENQTLATPISTHSIPNNNDNQDIVSMGTNSALLTKRVINNSYQVLSIEILSLLQAVDYLKIEDKLSKKNKFCYKTLREIVPAFETDDKRYIDLNKIHHYIKNNSFN